MKPAKKVAIGQPSWRLANKSVEAYLTETGGHLGPVTFNINGKKIAPFSVAWKDRKEKPPAGLPAILRVLRGDFFCMPFGGNTTPYRGERHPVHGEVANSRWKLESLDRRDGETWLHASMNTKVRKGRVDKRIGLIDGHAALYCRHTISQMSGPMPLGHHAMVKFPPDAGSGIVSTSPFVHGQTFYEVFERPENLGYSFLKVNATFDTLKQVPTITGEMTDITRFPARRGYEDILIIVADDSVPFAWVAVTFPKQGYVYFALKDPRVLRSTVLWISNGGRHGAPWNGKHLGVMGLEDVTANFAPGLAESANDNPISRLGYPTVIQLDPKKPTTINYIMAVAGIPKGFDEVKTIEAEQDGVRLTSISGKSVISPIDLEFLGSSS